MSVCTSRVSVSTSKVSVCTSRVSVCTSRASVCTSRVSVSTSRVSVCTSRLSVWTSVVTLDQLGKTSRLPPVRIRNMTAKAITIIPKTNSCELKEMQTIRTEDFITSSYKW